MDFCCAGSIRWPDTATPRSFTIAWRRRGLRLPSRSGRRPTPSSAATACGRSSSPPPPSATSSRPVPLPRLRPRPQPLRRLAPAPRVLRPIPPLLPPPLLPSPGLLPLPVLLQLAHPRLPARPRAPPVRPDAPTRLFPGHLHPPIPDPRLFRQRSSTVPVSARARVPSWLRRPPLHADGADEHVLCLRVSARRS